MASLRMYGEAKACASMREMLVRQGAFVDGPSETLSAGADSAAPPAFAALLREYPDGLPNPLVVRGNSYMLASDPSRVQSLMY